MEGKERIVVFSGAGVSAESGLKTFRDNDGLWENHEVTEVATPEAWQRNPDLVLRFYNMRRKQLENAKPNPAHYAIAALESKYEVVVITQNIDDLHEQAGSKKVIHLHGELKKVRSEKFPDLVYQTKKPEIQLGDLCEKGFQLRPHVVWFGEAVPMMDVALQESSKADMLVVVGTSLNVYPAASLIHAIPDGIPAYLVDPNIPNMDFSNNWTLLQEKAGVGMPKLCDLLIGQ
ncbi:MAG: NAD-dependent deacylase [Vicingaceae bacterium]